MLKLAAYAGIAVLAVLLLALVGVRLYFSDARIRALALDAAAQALGRRGVLELGQVHLRLLSGVELKDLRLRDPDQPSSPDILKFSRLAVRYRLLPLLWGRLVVKEIALEQPTVHIEQVGQKWNFESILPPATGETPAAPASAPPPQPPQPTAPIALPLTIELKSLRLSGLSACLRMPGTLDATLSDGEIQVQARLGAPGTTLHAKTSLSLPKVAVTLPGFAPLELSVRQDAEASLDLGTGDISLPAMDLQVSEFLRTRLKAKAKGFGEQRVELEEAGVEVDLAKLYARLKPLLVSLPAETRSLLEGLEIEGLFKVAVKAEGALAGGADRSAGLKVSGQTGIERLALKAPAFQAAVKGLNSRTEWRFDLPLPDGLPKHLDLKGNLQFSDVAALDKAALGAGNVDLRVSVPSLDKDPVKLGVDIRISDISYDEAPPAPPGFRLVPTDVSAGLEVESPTLDDLTKGVASIRNGHFAVEETLSAEFSASANFPESLFDLKLDLKRLDLALVKQVRLDSLPWLEAVHFGGTVSGSLSARGKLPSPEESAALNLPLELKLEVTGAGLAAEAEGLDARLKSFEIKLLHQNDHHFDLSLVAATERLSLVHSHGKGLLAAVLGESSGIPALDLAVTPSVQVQCGGSLPDLMKVSGLTVPVSLEAEFKTDLKGKFTNLIPDIPELRTEVSEFRTSLKVGLPDAQTQEQTVQAGLAIRRIGIEQTGSDSLPKSLSVPELEVVFPLLVDGKTESLKTVGEGLTYHLGKVLAGWAKLDIKDAGKGGVSVEKHFEADMKEAGRAFGDALVPILGGKAGASGKLTLDAAMKGALAECGAPLASSFQGDIQVALDLPSLDCGKLVRCERNKVGLKGAWSLEDGKVTASGDLKVAIEALSSDSPLPTSVDSISTDARFNVELPSLKDSPRFQVSVDGSLKGLGAKDLGSVNALDFGLKSATSTESPQRMGADFRLTLKEARLLAGGMPLPLSEVRIQSEAITIDLEKQEAGATLLVRSPDFGEGFETKLTAAAQQWGAKFAAELAVRQLDLAKLMKLGAAMGLLPPETPEFALKASGTADLTAKVTGDMPNDSQIQSLKLPVDIQAELTVHDGASAGLSQAVPPAEPTEAAKGGEAPKPLLVTLGLDGFGFQLRLLHKPETGMMTFDLAEFKEAQMSYADPVLGTFALPLVLSANGRIDDLANPRVQVEKAVFTCGEGLNGTAKGGLRAVTLSEVDFGFEADADLSPLSKAIPPEFIAGILGTGETVAVEGKAKIDGRLVSAAGGGEGIPDVLVETNVKAEMASLGFGWLAVLGETGAEMALKTSFSLNTGLLGDIDLSGKVVAKDAGFIENMILAPEIPELRFEIKGKSLAELKTELSALVNNLAYAENRVPILETDAKIELSPLVNLDTGDIALQGGTITFTTVPKSEEDEPQPWMSIGPIRGDIGNFGESLDLRFDKITVIQAPALRRLSGFIPGGTPADLEVKGSEIGGNLSVKATMPVPADFETRRMPVFLKTLMGGPPPYVVAALDGKFQVPAQSLTGDTWGLKAEDLTAEAETMIAGDDVRLAARFGVKALHLPSMLGAVSLDPTAGMDLEIKGFDAGVLKAAFSVPALGLAAKVDGTVGGIASLIRGGEAVLTPAMLAQALSGRLEADFELVLPQSMKLEPDMVVQGGVAAKTELLLRSGQELRLSGQVKIPPTSVRQGNLLELAGLQGSIPFRKSYTILQPVGEEGAGLAKPGLSETVIRDAASGKGAKSAESTEPAFADQIRAYSEVPEGIRFDFISYRGRRVVEGFSMALKVVEGDVRVEHLALKLLNGNVRGHGAVTLRRGRPRLELAAEFVDIASTDASDGKKTVHTKGFSGDIRLEVEVKASGKEAGISNVLGEVHLTEIGAQQLLVILSVLDPDGSNPEINTVRSILAIGEPKSVSLAIRHGTLTGQVTVKAVTTIVQDLPRISLMQLIRSKTIRDSLTAAIGSLQDVLAMISAESLEFGPDGSVKFR